MAIVSLNVLSKTWGPDLSLYWAANSFAKIEVALKTSINDQLVECSNGLGLVGNGGRAGGRGSSHLGRRQFVVR